MSDLHTMDLQTDGRGRISDEQWTQMLDAWFGPNRVPKQAPPRTPKRVPDMPHVDPIDDVTRCKAQAKLEYRAGGESLRQLVSEEDYVLSRMVDEGFAEPGAPPKPNRDPFENLSDGAKRFAAQAALEYRGGGDLLHGLVSEEEFVSSRLIDEGFTALGVFSADESPADTRPLHEKLPGLVAMHPTGSDVGSDDFTIH